MAWSNGRLTSHGCDGTVGMIAISYFAMTQLEAAVDRPPHLKAIFPVAVTSDLYEASVHHGLSSAGIRDTVPVHAGPDGRTQRPPLAKPAHWSCPPAADLTSDTSPVRHHER